MASLEVIRAYKALNLNELPEFLSIKQIAKLYYPANDKTDDRECIEEYIQTAIDSGSVQISSGGIFKPETSKTMQIANVVILPDAKPSEHTLEEWIEFFNGLDCGTDKEYCFYGYQTHRAILKERLSNGWPSKWDLITRSGSICEYSLIPLISSLHYEAWTDKPEPTEGSFLNGWLGISKQSNDKQQVIKKTGKGNHEPEKRQNQLHLLIMSIDKALSQPKRPTAQQVWNEIQHRHETYDTSNIIQEVNGTHISWCSGYGNEQTQSRKTFNKTLSKIRNTPPL